MWRLVDEWRSAIRFRESNPVSCCNRRMKTASQVSATITTGHPERSAREGLRGPRAESKDLQYQVLLLRATTDQVRICPALICEQPTIARSFAPPPSPAKLEILRLHSAPTQTSHRSVPLRMTRLRAVNLVIAHMRRASFQRGEVRSEG